MSDHDKKWTVVNNANGCPCIKNNNYGLIPAWTTEIAERVALLLNTGAEPKPELPAEVVELLEYVYGLRTKYFTGADRSDFIVNVREMVDKCAHLLPPKHRCIRAGCKGVPRTDFVKAMGLYTVECKQCGILGSFQESESEAWKAFYGNDTGCRHEQTSANGCAFSLDAR